MTTTFNSVTLPNASKIDITPTVLLKETLLLSGKRSIQTSAEIGLNTGFKCFGTFAEYTAIRALIGTSATLVTGVETYTKCYISALSLQESDNPAWFFFTVEFKQETT